MSVPADSSVLGGQWMPSCVWHNCFLGGCRDSGTSNLTLRPFLMGEYCALYLKWLLERQRAEGLIPSAAVCRGLSGSWRLSLHQWVKDRWLYDLMSYREMMAFGKGEFALVTCLPPSPQPSFLCFCDKIPYNRNRATQRKAGLMWFIVHPSEESVKKVI